MRKGNAGKPHTQNRLITKIQNADLLSPRVWAPNADKDVFPVLKEMFNLCGQSSFPCTYFAKAENIWNADTDPQTFQPVYEINLAQDMDVIQHNVLVYASKIGAFKLDRIACARSFLVASGQNAVSLYQNIVNAEPSGGVKRWFTKKIHPMLDELRF